MKTIPSKEFLDNMSKDQGYWKGPFYLNKRDPRLMVPKINESLGWTLNFAHPAAYIAMIALAAIIIVSVVFL
jgi:uncharacterized membrane protein